MIAASIPKPQNEELPSGMRPNEDSILHKPELGLFAVADGAGGTGIFSGDWAQYLLEKLPPKPLTSYDELTAWINLLWEDFYQKKEEALQDDGVRKSKFYQEGSAATLLAIWRDGNTVHWMSYGDSNLIWLDSEGSYQDSFPLKKLQEFTNFPHLVNWQDEWMKPEGFQAETLECNAGDRLLLATDALSQTLLLWTKPSTLEESLPSEKITEIQQRFCEHPPKLNIHQLLEKLEADFGSTIQELHEQGYLLNDDCSLVELHLPNSLKV